SAIFGDNIVFISKLMNWYDGVTLLNILETININPKISHNYIRFPVQYVNRPNLDFRGYSGTLVAGVLNVGDIIKVLPGNITSTITKIVMFNKNLQKAKEKQSVTLVLKDNIDVSRGDMIVNIDSTLNSVRSAVIDIVWMSETPLLLNKLYDVKLINKKTRAYIKKIFHKINVNTLITSITDTLLLNDIGTVEIIFEEPVLCDMYTLNKTTGSLILIDRLHNTTIAAGMIKNKLNENIQNHYNKNNNFEFELNSLICQYFPHWGTKKL
ncbi:MAG TPA: sulfate adenylyltransferase subunit CysN, partial [Buchnera sp. (in: enterobacteria)]|nr:sulfate adenylyltransferase subunit CysN [Buchnera sp. (in: enterobacteria)]